MADDWLDELNEAQREAVTFGEGPLLVVAGAGTGKTKTLACRVAWLIRQGVPPDRILLLTFTRRAAAEMIRRATQLVKAEEARNVWGGTFHAVANRLLRIHGEAIGLPTDFTVMDQNDAADLMNLIRTELGVAKGDRRFPKKATLVKIYSHTVNAQRSLVDTVARHFPWCNDDVESIGSVFKRYVQRKTASRLLDYDDLLLYWQALAQTNDVGKQVADRFQHVLVDEYQDTNVVQSALLRAMRRRFNNIMVVGDDAQSIYSFRAATVRNILDFSAQFDGARTVTLEQNYRSTTPILLASNAVMAQAAERYTKELWSQRDGDQKPVLVHCQDETQQTAAVCRQIVSHLEAGTALQQQAVLFRAGHHSAELEIELAKRNIPFHKFGGLKFLEAAHIKDVISLMRILENPSDELSWFRVLLLFHGIGPRTARRILDELCNRSADDSPAGGGEVETAPTENESAVVSPVWRLIHAPPTVPSAARDNFEEMRQLFADLMRFGEKPGLPDAQTRPPKWSIAVELERINRFYVPILELNYDNQLARKRDLEQLEQLALRYRSRSSFVTDLTLDPPTGTADLAGPPHLDEDWLTLSTIHSAKGCEWDVVHIIHAADGMIPSDMALGDEEGLEEERRLFYVAMTRARDDLYVYFPVRYYHRKQPLGDRHTFVQLTRFLDRHARGHFEERAADLLGDQSSYNAAAELRDKLDGLWDASMD